MKKNYRENENLKSYTTLKIGGPAKRLYEPQTLDELKEILQEASESCERVCLLGNGSNVLFDDEGFDGWVVRIADNYAGIELEEDNTVRVKAGTTNQQLAEFCARHGLEGYEFASGIPGTIGGAIVMNAGAYDGETKDVLKEVTFLDENLNLQTAPVDELDMGYRHSRFSDSDCIIVEGCYQFHCGDPDKIADKIADLKEKRWSKQPMDQASAGSTFKRPQGSFASKLIHDSNLQGVHVGDAMVSQKHAGFLINCSQATCKDFLTLVELVQKTVMDNYGIALEMEVKHIPFHQD